MLVRNRFRLSDHFFLDEFEDPNRDGLVVVHPSLIDSLEHLRQRLYTVFSAEIALVITCGTRTNKTNERLAETLGWIEDGGRVAKDSRHLPHHGGIAADFMPLNLVTNRTCPICDVAPIARDFFDFVLEYPSHIHADNRHRVQTGA